MSAALLMTDNWQPTVLQLMPFSSNNASHIPSPSPDRLRGYSQTRGFPTLAVTRSRSVKDGVKPVRVWSERMPRPHPTQADSSPPQRARSEYNARVRNSLVTIEGGCSVKNVNSGIISKSVEQNDTTDSSDNLSTSDIVKNNVKHLPKPSPCRSLDGRYFLPQNGFFRSVTMTPGEMDLQKHRDKFVKDNAQPTKSKKYKLNVNQLPRSTTPINDNDPDKLNMKQVIRFLQTKEAHSDSNGQTTRKPDRRAKSGYPSTAPSRIAVRDSIDKDTRQTDAGMPPMLPFRREVTSVMYTTNNSHPHSLKKRGQRNRRDPDNATKPNDSANRSSFKNTREFRLHRFLTMAPNADDFTHVTQTHPISSAHKRLLITECSKTADIETESMRNSCSPVPPYLPSRQGERYAKLHYRLPNRRVETTHTITTATLQPHRQSKDTSLVKEGVIRLPSMLDFNNDSDNDEPKDGESWKKNVHGVTRDVDSPYPPSLEVNGDVSTPSSSDKDVFSDSEASSKPSSRRVTVSLPRESPTDVMETWERSRRTADPVRLSLRQETKLTREKTYMSDMAKHKPDSDEHSSVTPILPSMVTKRGSKTDDESGSRNS